MVSSRCKKRLIVLVFLSAIALVCLYKIQQKRSNYITRALEQTKDFSSVTADKEKSISESEDEADDSEEENFIRNITTGREATEPPKKIHRGLNSNEEVEDTLDWLHEHGVKAPPDPSPEADNEAEETTTSQVISTAPPSTTTSSTAPPSTATSSSAPPLTTSRTASSSTQPRKGPLTSERIENGGADLKTTSSIFTLSDTSSKAQRTHSSLSNDAFVSKRTRNGREDLKTTPSSSILSDTSVKSQITHSSLSSNAFTEGNNTFTLTRTTSTNTGAPTPTYTPSPSQNTCKLPKLDPWDPSIRHLLYDVGNDPGCRREYPPPAFDVIGNRLVLTGEVNANSIDFEHVNVETIHRNDGDDGNVHFVNRGNPFDKSSEEFNVSNVIDGSDFFRLKYQLTSGKENTHYFARVVPQPRAMEESRRVRQEMKQQGKSGELDLNIVMLGFDSVSAASFLRKMPKTVDFLKTSLKTYFISGQAVIGDATTPALTAMLTGLYETEVPEGRQGYDNSGPIDKWPWLMKLYKEHGYVTMMAEDDPSMGAFNLRLRGFEESPAHHYARPFWLALEQNSERDGPGLCSRSTFMVNFTLDYILSYFASYPDTPKFVFSFMSYLAHAHPNHLSFADNDLLRLLRTFVKRNYHGNTVIVIFGDHGSRNDEVRNTMQGKLEERLPWLSISVPPWLEEKYPDVTSALEQNQHVISSPFDLHATLHHVLTYPKEPEGEKTQSLFTKLKHTRTCSEAGIGEHWCPCLEFKGENITSPQVIGGAEMAVKYINDVILNRIDLLRKSCARIQLKKILKAESFKPNEKLQRFSSTNQDSDRAVNFGSLTSDSAHYRINFMTSPGNALFEATVAIRGDNKVIVNPSISRTNVYGNQPICILRKYPYARKYCYCKQLRT